MKVVSLSPVWRDELARRLNGGIDFVVVDPSDGPRLAEELPGADVLLTTRFDRQMADTCRSLALILCPAAGTEGIDRSAVPAGVEVVNGTGHEMPMAEYALGALVALRQRFAAADAGLRKGTWRFGFFGTRGMVEELFGSTLGLIGFGRIGVEIARRAKPFGITCHAVTLHPDKPVESGLLAAAPGALEREADVDGLLATSDAVVIACELSQITRGLIDARRFAMMRRSAVLVNIARGPIVDEKALYEALRDGTIAGAAIDVWYGYPEAGHDQAEPSRYPFATLENVMMTPHSSGWTAGAKERKLDFLAREINTRFEV